MSDKLKTFTEHLESVSTDKLILPTKNGWYWVLLDGWNTPTPCWYYYDENDENDSYFLPGGMGDESRDGVHINEIEKIGPEIIVPNF